MCHVSRCRSELIGQTSFSEQFKSHCDEFRVLFTFGGEFIAVSSSSLDELTMKVTWYYPVYRDCPGTVSKEERA